VDLNTGFYLLFLVPLSLVALRLHMKKANSYRILGNGTEIRLSLDSLDLDCFVRVCMWGRNLSDAPVDTGLDLPASLTIRTWVCLTDLEIRET
jgi:hypothetical protein